MQWFITRSVIMPKLQKINFFLMSPTGERITFLKPPLDADNFWPYCPRPCGPFRLLKSSIWSKWFSQKKYFGTFRHFGFPRGKFFRTVRKTVDRWWISQKCTLPLRAFLHGENGLWFGHWLIKDEKRWKKTKKTQKNPTKWIFLEKRQQKKIPKFLR